VKDYDRRAREIREQLHREKRSSRIRAVLLGLLIIAAVVIGLWQLGELWDQGCRPWYFSNIWVCPR
jgi:F0F1-type ATP synthase assembly protein I